MNVKMRRVLTRYLWLVAVLTAAGCQGGAVSGPSSGGRVLLTPVGSISAPQLAERLDLHVKEVTPAHVLLGDGANSVLISTHSTGRVYVNGESVSAVGSVHRIDDVYFFEEQLEPRIRRHLRGAMPLPLREPVRSTFRPRVSGRRIMVDAGHGGKDPGAQSACGLREKDVNLAVAKMLARLLRGQGHEVMLTREDDRFIELNERARMANVFDPDLFVSIHADAAHDRSVRGYTVYVARAASREACEAAELIDKAYRQTGLNSRGVQRADYRVLVRTACPAVLMELGFLTHSQEAGLLGDGTTQEGLAQELAAGINRYLSMKGATAGGR